MPTNFEIGRTKLRELTTVILDQQRSAYSVGAEIDALVVLLGQRASFEFDRCRINDSIGIRPK